MHSHSAGNRIVFLSLRKVDVLEADGFQFAVVTKIFFPQSRVSYSGFMAVTRHVVSSHFLFPLTALCNFHRVTLDGPHRSLYPFSLTGARAAHTSQTNLATCCVLFLDDYFQANIWTKKMKQKNGSLCKSGKEKADAGIKKP